MAADLESARNLIKTAYRWLGRNFDNCIDSLVAAQRIIQQHANSEEPDSHAWKSLQQQVQDSCRMISDYRAPEQADGSRSILDLSNILLAQADRLAKKQPMSALLKYESVDRTIMHYVASHPQDEYKDYLVRLSQRAIEGCQTANQYRLMLIEKFRPKMPHSMETLRKMETNAPCEAILWYGALEASLRGQMGKEGIRIIGAEPDLKIEGDINIFRAKYLLPLEELAEGRERAEQNQHLLRLASLGYARQ